MTMYQVVCSAIFLYLRKTKINNKMEETIRIDIPAVLKSKAPNTHVPKFLVNYLKKIVHQDEINHFFETHPGCKDFDFLAATLDYFQVDWSVEGEENLPTDDKKYIFVSNHPLGGMDGMILALILGRKYNGKIRVLINDLLMNLKPLQGIFVPVNKTGAQSKKNVHLVDAAYESDNHLLTFPAGACSRKQKGGIIADWEWKKNFIAKSVQYQRDVVPIYFEGRNSNFYYNLSRIRLALGIKLNLELFYLADEMFRQRGNHFTIRFGKPIPWQTFDKTRKPQEWAQWVKGKSYAMR